MIIKEFSIGNTQILVDDMYYPKSEEERQNVYEEFNRIGCEILYTNEKEVITNDKERKEIIN